MIFQETEDLEPVMKETKDEATFCCKTRRFVAKVEFSSFGEKVR